MNTKPYFILYEEYDLTRWDRDSCILYLDPAMFKRKCAIYTIKNLIRTEYNLDAIRPITILDIKRIDTE